jgi:hypothetical protein
MRRRLTALLPNIMAKTTTPKGWNIQRKRTPILRPRTGIRARPIKAVKIWEASNQSGSGLPLAPTTLLFSLAFCGAFFARRLNFRSIVRQARRCLLSANQHRVDGQSVIGATYPAGRLASINGLVRCRSMRREMVETFGPDRGHSNRHAMRRCKVLSP